MEKQGGRAPVEILIAEGDPAQADVLKHLLEEQGHTVTTAENGGLAFEAAKQRLPKLIVSDIVMPDMDGFAFCKAVKADEGLKHVPVILMTSLSNVHDILKGLECGADNVICKLHNPENLLSRIRYLLDNRELRDSNRSSSGLEIFLGGKKHLITSESIQILDLLISSFEQAIQLSKELRLRENETIEINAELRLRVTELKAAIEQFESFSYSVAYDVLPPLRTIDSNAQMLWENFTGQLGTEGRRLVGAIRDDTRKMGELIEGLLEYSRLGRAPVSSAEVNMNDIVAEVVGNLVTNGKGPMPAITVAELLPAKGDLTLLKQVWANLLSNAIKFSRGARAPAIEVGASRQGKELVYRVRDNGAGFNMHYYDKLFGVFQRLHSDTQFPGTGIGLAIVQQIVTRHGGRVWAEGKVNEGATFYFALPK
jgi:signal transduction histidine kinase